MMTFVHSRRRAASSFVLASTCALALPVTARAALGDPTDDLAVDPLAEWKARGLGQSRGMPVLPQGDDGPREQAPIGPKTIKQGVIFVNFEAVTTQMGGDNSQMNISEIFAGDWEAYGGTETERSAVMEAVRLDWQPYDVLIVDERPESGDYTMNITSPTNPLGGGVLGIAPIDCSDMFTHNNITFAFHGANDGFPPAVQATTIGQEVAHSFGLEHVDDPLDIMNPFNSGADPSFKDECIPIVQGGACTAQHMEFCPDGMSQNSHQALLGLFGTSAPDTVAPTVTISSPANGAEFNEGAEFLIEAIAADDRSIGQLQLYNGDTKLQSKTEEPYTWEVEDIPEGYYRFRVVATDPAGNEAESNLVDVIVGDPELPAEDDGFADEESGSGGTDAGMNDDGGGGNGCGCGPARERSGLAPLGLVFALRMRRRRA